MPAMPPTASPPNDPWSQFKDAPADPWATFKDAPATLQADRSSKKPRNLSGPISEARSQGYSDPAIAAYLAKDPMLGPQIREARAAGYSDAEIISHLGRTTTPAPVKPAQAQRSEVHDLDGPWTAYAAAKPAKRSVIDQATGFMANVNRGMGVGDEMAAGFQTAGDLLSGKAKLKGSLADMARTVGDNYTSNLGRQRQIEDQYAAGHPHMAALAKGAGNVPMALVPMGDGALAAAGSGRLANMARGAASAGASAAGYAAVDRGSARERLRAMAQAAGDPVVLGMGAAGGAMIPTTKAAKPKISEDVVTLRKAGVQLTPGQMRGGAWKAAEDAGTSTPILGTAIQEARQSGLESFGRANANEALSHIGQALPADIAPGGKTIVHVHQAFGDAYDSIIPGRHVVADPEMKQAIFERLSDVSQDMTPQARARLNSLVSDKVTSRFGAPQAVDGETFQKIISGLRASRDRFASSTDADQRAIGEGLGIVMDEIRNAAARQDPAFAEAKAATDKGYALFKRMQAAAASPGAEGGVYTAAQYGRAVLRGDKSLDKAAYAEGDALGQKMAAAGQAVLPSKIPDSGTATRSAYGVLASAPGALWAAGATGGLGGLAAVAGGYGVGLSALKAASRMYTPDAIALANKILDKRIARDQATQALRKLENMAASDPRARAVYQQVVAQIVRSAGAASVTSRTPGSQGVRAAARDPVLEQR